MCKWRSNRVRLFAFDCLNKLSPSSSTFKCYSTQSLPVTSIGSQKVAASLGCTVRAHCAQTEIAFLNFIARLAKCIVGFSSRNEAIK